MGLTKDPDAIRGDHEDDNEVSSCAEDELLSEWGQVHLGPMPMKQYLELQMNLVLKRCHPRRRPKTIIMIGGLGLLVALAAWGTTSLRQSSNPALRTPTPATPEQVAAEQAALQNDLTKDLGANFKATDYTAGDQKVDAQSSELQHDLRNSLGNTFEAGKYRKEELSPKNQQMMQQNLASEHVVNHEHPEQWMSHMDRPHRIVPHTSSIMHAGQPPPVSSQQAAVLQREVAGSLGANFKAGDYAKEEHNRQNREMVRQNLANEHTVNHEHPEQWRPTPRPTLIPPHLSSHMKSQVPVAQVATGQPSVPSAQAELQHELAANLGTNFQAGQFAKEELSAANQEMKRQNLASEHEVNHEHPEQWRPTPRPTLIPPHLSSHMKSQVPVAHAASPDQQETQGCDFKTWPTCPARSLFLSTEIHRVVTDNLVRTSSRLLSQGDYEMVNEFAWLGFKKINAELATRAPDIARGLDALQLKPEQKNAVLDVMALLSNPSVESLGYNIAKIIRRSTFATKKYLKFNIEDSLEPMDGVRRMAGHLLPLTVTEAWRAPSDDGWALTLDPENIRAMRMDTIRPNATGAGMDFKTKSLSVYAGVLQQGKVMLEIMRTYLSAGAEWSLGTHDTLAPLLNGITPPTAKDKLDYMETFLWPLKCSSQGIDALRVSLGPRFDGSSSGNQKKLDLVVLPDAVKQKVESEIQKNTEGLESLRAKFKR